MVSQGLAHFSERVAMRISFVTYKADIILLNCLMCSSVDMWEKFLSRFRPSCIKCGGPVGDKKAPLLQFSPLLLPTLPKFAHFAHLRLGKLSKPVPHLEDGGTSSQRLLFSSMQCWSLLSHSTNGGPCRRGIP